MSIVYHLSSRILLHCHCHIDFSNVNWDSPLRMMILHNNLVNDTNCVAEARAECFLKLSFDAAFICLNDVMAGCFILRPKFFLVRDTFWMQAQFTACSGGANPREKYSRPLICALVSLRYVNSGTLDQLFCVPPSLKSWILH